MFIFSEELLLSLRLLTPSLKLTQFSPEAFNLTSVLNTMYYIVGHIAEGGILTHWYILHSTTYPSYIVHSNNQTFIIIVIYLQLVNTIKLI